MKEQEPERKRRRRIWCAVIIEIVIMIISTLCVLIPLPWRLIVPIAIGTREIIKQAYAKIKEPKPTPPIVYCNGHKAPDKLNKEPKQNVRRTQKARPEPVGAGTEKTRKQVKE